MTVETRILDGRKIAREIRAEVARQVDRLAREGPAPGLAVVLAGCDPASQIYVRGKTRTCGDLGLLSERIDLPAEVSTREVVQAVARLNRREEIDGILVQLPLPAQVDQEKVLCSIDPAKDVDGFHPLNLGRLCRGHPHLVPCTPLGIMQMLDRERIPLEGARAVIVGRSNIVGKPMAMLLLQRHCTVTICHSRTRDLAGVCRQADILVAAAGTPGLITRECIRPGAVVIDVGVNRIETREQVLDLFGKDSPKLEVLKRRGSVLVGDVAPRAPLGLATAVTPVPGGVGPLTIALLMQNTARACRLRRQTRRREK